MVGTKMFLMFYLIIRLGKRVKMIELKERIELSTMLS
jgi:hypothetical protein